jgi:hypothetical protein
MKRPTAASKSPSFALGDIRLCELHVAKACLRRARSGASDRARVALHPDHRARGTDHLGEEHRHVADTRTEVQNVHATRGDCALQFDPVGRNSFDARSCDVIKSFLAHEGVSHTTQWLEVRGPARLEIGDESLAAPEAATLAGPGRADAIAAFRARAATALGGAGFRAEADPASIDRVRVVAILVALLAFASFTSGTYGALLVELFPARVRYTAVSFPQNVGNGWFGGLLPAIAFAIVAATGDIFAGLWYPVTMAALSLLVALPETRHRPTH